MKIKGNEVEVKKTLKRLHQKNFHEFVAKNHSINQFVKSEKN